MTNSNYVEKKHRQKNVLANMYGKVPFFIIWRVSKGQLVFSLILLVIQITLMILLEGFLVRLMSF